MSQVRGQSASTETFIKEVSSETDGQNLMRKVKKKRLVKVLPVTTSTTVKPRKSSPMDAKKIEESFLSPEDWLERFYNGKNLLRQASQQTFIYQIHN